MAKITVTKPIVEIEGDEMARVIWQHIKERLILPHLDVPLLPFDLSMSNRDKTDDAITTQAALAIKEHGVGVKCATITSDENRLREFKLKRLYPSPNATIRNILKGTIFREPIVCANVPRKIPSWQNPIVIARHAFGDQYQGCDIPIDDTGKLELVFTNEAGDEQRHEVHRFASKGVALAMFNMDDSIADFARSCFRYGLTRQLPVYLSTKNTILKTYDGRFMEIFAAIYREEFESDFRAAHISYEHRLIDDMAAMALRSSGGFLWAAKNYDGDVQSDVIAQGFGSLGLMTSVLMTSDGTTVETEAAHGTVTRHYRAHQKGEATSTNPLASIFAWSRALFHRARLDHNEPLRVFSQSLEQLCLDCVAQGCVTKDLALLTGPHATWLTTEHFFDALVTQGKDTGLFS